MLWSLKRRPAERRDGTEGTAGSLARRPRLPRLGGGAAQLPLCRRPVPVVDPASRGLIQALEEIGVAAGVGYRRPTTQADSHQQWVEALQQVQESRSGCQR
jgi:hypothetical protein